MAESKGKKVSSLLRAMKAISSAAEDVTLKHYVGSLETSTNLHKGSTSKILNLSRSKSILDQLSLDNMSHNSDDSAKVLQEEISHILCGSTSLPNNSLGSIHLLPGDKSFSQNNITPSRKETSRDRMQKSVFRNTQSRRFDRFVNMYADKLGTDSTNRVFGILGQEAGIKEYNNLIGLCMKKAKAAEDEDVTLEEVSRAYQLFTSMREHSLQLEEETYGQVLTFLIDMELVEQFIFFCEFIRHESPNSLPRLAYYEMLLWVKLDDEDKIEELCDSIATDDGIDNSSIKENYLLAFCESGRKKELLMLLDIIDITKISSMVHLATIFRSLARLLLESHAKNFILALKSCDTGAEKISKLISHYAITVPNLALEDTILKFESLHKEMEVMPVPESYNKLIEHCCTLLKVNMALDIVDHMFESGLTLSLETFHLMLQTCEESCDYNLVHRIYSLIRSKNLVPTNETFRIMISLSMQMKDFEGAYNMIKDMKKMSLKPTESIYNTINAAHFREYSVSRVLKDVVKSSGGILVVITQTVLVVLKEMEPAPGKPYSRTFSYLITNSEHADDIIKEASENQLNYTKCAHVLCGYKMIKTSQLNVHKED